MAKHKIEGAKDKGTKHTPGPWFAVNYSGYYSLQKEDYYSDKDDLLNEEKCPDAEANAKLAAAAPDLLEVLQKVIHAIQHSNMKGTILHGEITAAIKKATLKIKV